MLSLRGKDESAQGRGKQGSEVAVRDLLQEVGRDDRDVPERV